MDKHRAKVKHRTLSKVVATSKFQIIIIISKLLFLQYFYILTTGFLLISLFIFNINNIFELGSIQELILKKLY